MSDLPRSEPGPPMVTGPDAQALLHAALMSPIPRFHVNGTVMALAGGDLIVALISNGNPVAILNLPFMTARGLVDDLQTALADIGRALGSPIPSAKDLADGMARVRQEGAASTSASSQ